MNPDIDEEIERIVAETRLKSVAISFYDHETASAWNYRGDTFFHAASTIKVAILMTVFALIDEGIIEVDSEVHVRNRFFSVADGTPYKMQVSRDACTSLYASLGTTVPVAKLAYYMIVTSSNLATNLLVDIAGVDALQSRLAVSGIPGIELRRGVEDEAAFEAGIINRATANGLVQLFNALYGYRNMDSELAQKMLDILLAQEFNSGLPIGVPEQIRSSAQFAHKTGEISTVAHDAGMVFLPDREPYTLAILTERVPGESDSRKAIQALSRLAYREFIEGNTGDRVRHVS